MPAELPAPRTLTDAEREELARRLCALLYDLWLRKQDEAFSSAPAPRRRHAPGDGAGDTPPRRPA